MIGIPEVAEELVVVVEIARAVRSHVGHAQIAVFAGEKRPVVSSSQYFDAPVEPSVSRPRLASGSTV